MLLENVYNSFVKHTGLTDVIYRSVFINISDILKNISDIDWMSCSYTDSEQGVEFYFDDTEYIPLFIIELIFNIFENFYTLPEDAEMSVSLRYKDKEYTIRHDSTDNTIPTDLEFIRKNKLFRFFVLDRPVADLFMEFDRIFEFINGFQRKITSVYQPLQKLFNKESDLVIKEKTHVHQDITMNKLNIEKLKVDMDRVLEDITKVNDEKINLQKERNELVQKLNQREALLSKREKLSIEYSTILQNRQNYVENRTNIEKILADINVTLEDIAARKTASDDVVERDLFIKKKTAFEKNLMHIDALLQNIDATLNDILSKRQSTVSELEVIDQISISHIENIDKEIQLKEERYEKLYNTLVNLESELKKQKHEEVVREASVENDASYATATITDIEKTSIASHLSSPLQPTAVLTVQNYLRYYFYHYANLKVEQDITNIDSSLKKSIYSRLILLEHFNISLNKLFTIIDYTYPSTIKKIVKITRE